MEITTSRVFMCVCKFSYNESNVDIKHIIPQIIWMSSAATWSNRELPVSVYGSEK